MRQALHIFTKDVRFLRWEILVVVLLEIILGWAGQSPDPWLEETIFLLAACFLIARVVHAEAIPGHNQFWITRPYRWPSLLGAKLLFILVFVNVPLLLIQLFTALSFGFPVVNVVPALLWSQLLMIVCISLPVGALAALTSGLAAFLFLALLSIAAIALVNSADIPMLLFRYPPIHPASAPAGIDWVKNSLAVTGVALICAFIWYVQYRHRRSNLSRAISLCAVILTATVYFSFPWKLAWNLQAALSRKPFHSQSLLLAIDPTLRGKFPMPGRERVKGVEVLLPLVLSGVPPGIEAHADAASILLEGENRRTWQTAFAGVNRQTAPSGATVFYTYLIVDRAFFEEVSSKPITVRARLYLTLFGNAQRQKIPMQNPPVNTLAGLRCGTGAFSQLYCRSVFRWPGQRVYAQFGEDRQDLFTSFLSYSPFPAELKFGPIDSHWVSRPESDSEVTILTVEPIAHLDREFTITGLQISKDGNLGMIR